MGPEQTPNLLSPKVRNLSLRALIPKIMGRRRITEYS